MLRTAVSSFVIPGVMAACVVPVALGTREFAAALVFAVACALCVTIGLFGRRRIGDSGGSKPATELATVALCWLIMVCVGSVLTWSAVRVTSDSGGAPELADVWSSVFETVSGSSTTGLSMLSDVSTADAWLQWWRSLLQWFGALGVVLFAVGVAEPSGDQDSFIDTEWSDPPGDDARGAVVRLTTVLVGLTVFAFAGLALSGEPAWRAANHAMSAASTGGFTITSDSAGSSPVTAQVVLCVTMFVSALSFGTVWDVIRRKGVAWYRRTQLRFALALSTVGIAVSVAVGAGEAPIGSLVFNAISSSTTSGFSIGDGYVVISAVSAVAMVSMFIGGSAGSTAGGVKVARIGWMGKAAVRWIPGDSEVGDTEGYTWDNSDVEESDARHRIMGAAAIISTFLSAIVVGSVIMAVSNRAVGVGSIVFEAISAASGVGLSHDVANAGANSATKATLTVLMFAGRVEMTALIVLVLRPLIRQR